MRQLEGERIDEFVSRMTLTMKVDAIMSAGPLRDSNELKSLYGLSSDASKYIRDAATYWYRSENLLRVLNSIGQ